MEQGVASEVSLKSVELGGGSAKEYTCLATKPNRLRARFAKRPNDLVAFHGGQ